MKASILFFGATADVVGKRGIELTLSETATAKEAFAQVVADHPELSRYKLLFSLNQNYAEGDEVVSDGDELAIFTAVSGG